MQIEYGLYVPSEAEAMAKLLGENAGVSCANGRACPNCSFTISDVQACAICAGLA
jgi:hypothetical protein